jgi:pyruvate dehydrogenase E2 component (dihydrolipoamide acetyltransferase)
MHVTVPDIGDFNNIPVIEILVKPGDRVAKDAPLIILESDKATLDVPSPEGGTVRELQITLGDKVSAGSMVLTLDLESAVPPSTAIPAAAAEDPVGSREAPAPLVALLKPLLVVDNEPAAASRFQRSPHASPSMRRIAREFGVDLRDIKGTGPRGRIVKNDLQHFVKSALRQSPTNGSEIFGQLRLVSAPPVDFAAFGAIERAPLSKIRKIAGANLSRNSVLIPHVTNFEDADITDLDIFRKAMNAERDTSESRFTILPFLIKACACTLAKFPTFNSSLDGEELVIKRYFHIGFAADTPNGLVVPVIRDVDKKGISEIAGDAIGLASRAREGKLKPADIQGGCFTISSLGGIGGTGFTPIINAPEVAILGATRAQMRPVWDGKAFVARFTLPLSLSWDHRVVDGVAAARFLVHLSGLLADFRRITI